MATRTSIFATNDNVTANDLNSLAGAWNSYTPTVAQGASTNIAKTVDYAKYLQFGKLVIGQVSLSLTGTGTAASPITISLPVTAASTNIYVGQGYYYDASGPTYYPAFTFVTVSSTLALARPTDGGNVGSNPNIAVANGDTYVGSFMYEAA